MPMHGPKLIISRGIPAHAASPARDSGQRPRPELVRTAPPPRAPERALAAPSAAADYHLVGQRIDALERLSLLRDIGVLTPEEFAAEKALVLSLPAEELLLDTDLIPPPRGPSLLGRLLSWKLLVVGALAGLVVSAYTAPQDLMTLADRASRLIG